MSEEQVEVPDSDLAKLIPAPLTIKVGDVTVTIKTVKVGMLPEVLKAVTPFSALLPAPGKGKPRPRDTDLVPILIHHTPDVVRLVELLTDQTADWVNNLDIDQMLDVLTAVLAVNLDFFIQRVLPSLSQATGRLGNDVVALTGLIHGQSRFKD